MSELKDRAEEALKSNPRRYKVKNFIKESYERNARVKLELAQKALHEIAVKVQS